MAAKVPKKTLWIVWMVLVGLVGVSWAVSLVQMGPGDVIVPLLISAGQMVMVILFFMHARYSERLVWLFICGGFLWLAIMVDLTLADYLTRGASWSQWSQLPQ